MAEFKLLPIPTEDYDVLGIGPNSIIETSVNESRALVIRAINPEDTEDFACDGNCESCPVSETDCDGDCQGCPCYALCEDSDWRKGIE